MSNTITPDSSQKEFVVIPTGSYVARCIRVVDLGTQTRPKYGVPGKFELKDTIMLVFEVPSETIEDKEGNVMPMLQSKEYTKSMHENAGLRIDLKKWRTRDYTPEELERFDVNKVCGQPCIINIEHSVSTKNGRTYAKIASIVPLIKGMECPPAVHSQFTYEIEEGVGGHFEELPKWIQDKILSAKEWTIKNEPQTVSSDEPPPYSGDDAPPVDYTQVSNLDLPF